MQLISQTWGDTIQNFNLYLFECEKSRELSLHVFALLVKLSCLDTLNFKHPLIEIDLPSTIFWKVGMKSKAKPSF